MSDLVSAVRLLAGLGLLSCGALAVRSDFLKGRVWNRDLAVLLGLLLALYAGAIAATLLGQRGWVFQKFYVGGFYGACAIHAALSAAAAVGLWKIGVWPSGDAKLFAALSAGLPLAASSLPNFPFTTFVVVLSNIFVPAALFVAVEAAWVAWRTRWRHHVGFMLDLPGIRAKLDWAGRTAVRGAVERWRTAGYGAWAVLFFTAGALVEAAVGEAGGRLRPLTPFAAVAVYWALGRLAETVRPGPLSTAAVLGVWSAVLVVRLDWLEVVGRAAWRWSWFGLLCWLYFESARSLRDETARGESAYRRWDRFQGPIEKVGPWVLLVPEEWERVRREDPDFYQEHLEGGRYPDGLTPEQARVLRGWWKRRGIAYVDVQRVVPFAPWIVVGFALTWCLGRDVVGMAG